MRVDEEAAVDEAGTAFAVGCCAFAAAAAALANRALVSAIFLWIVAMYIFHDVINCVDSNQYYVDYLSMHHMS
jgi:hypothetical protein